ncbi:MAG TPA: hypothetical protein VF631_13250 [Allosphingosinicella sp.]|jgi:tetratricopeptide (TPR) repeat protein|uniref:hypothetical protein n=1 Tax=Allosphingosinicella sp. TaxID=2823234 RepID=UPI002F274EFC
MRALLLALGTLAAGFPTSVIAQAAAEPTEYLAKLQSEGDRNRVLNQMEIGTRYFWAERDDLSAAAFNDAIEKIETVFKQDPGATKARSLWYEEGSKSFKGEPYERAMVYYYRGLGYLRAGDYENARAAFRQGLMQDAFAEELQDQADFALLLYLEAWASHLNGDADLRDEAMKRVKAIRPDVPDIGADHDTLVLVETGTAPRKLGDGANHSYFVYRRGKGFKENKAELLLGSEPLRLYPIEDVYTQASTRGGRAIDKILDGKVEFKRTTGSVGSGLAQGATMFSAMGGGGAAAGAIGAVGAIASLMSANAKPRADTRQWSSLPDTVHVLTLASAKAGSAPVVVKYYAGEEPGAREDQPITFKADPKGKRLGLLRSR